MPFSEKIKLEVKRKAHYKCCWCREIRNSLEVHHIIPEEDDGPSTIKNAVPLCKNCHDMVGSNPKKRKEIRERRDFWYEQCEKSVEDPKMVKEMYGIVSDMKKNNDEKIKEVKTIVDDLFKQTQALFSKLNTSQPDGWSDTLSQISTTTSTIATGSGTMINLESSGEKYHCSKCNYSGITFFGGECPICDGNNHLGR